MKSFRFPAKRLELPCMLLYNYRKFTSSNIFESVNMQGKHIEQTRHNTRENITASAQVIDAEMESPTVRRLTLRVDEDKFKFKAGQWVDLFIPGIETVGGFSICSPPEQCKRNSTIELGVKKSDWPPSFWIHNHCHIGSLVNVRVGGDFFYDPRPGQTPTGDDVLLLGGGVGINPLASMLFHAAELHKKSYHSTVYRPGKVVLLFCATNLKELLYKNRLDAAVSNDNEMQVKYFTSKETTSSQNVFGGRITQEIIHQCLNGLKTSSLKCFICGPPHMINTMKNYLTKEKIQQHQIFYENWWTPEMKNKDTS